MSFSRPACSNTRNRAFLDPEHSPDRSIRAALKICEGCPLLTTCAREAVVSGITLDGYCLPPSGVIAGGILLDGTPDTAAVLAAVAGIPAPTWERPRRRRVKGCPCVSCGRPLWPWVRDRAAVPSGYVMHYAREYCVECRVVYRQHEEHEEEGTHALRKSPRRRSVPPPVAA